MKFTSSGWKYIYFCIIWMYVFLFHAASISLNFRNKYYTFLIHYIYLATEVTGYFLIFIHSKT